MRIYSCHAWTIKIELNGLETCIQNGYLMGYNGVQWITMLQIVHQVQIQVLLYLKMDLVIHLVLFLLMVCDVYFRTKQSIVFIYKIKLPKIIAGAVCVIGYWTCYLDAIQPLVYHIYILT